MKRLVLVVPWLFGCSGGAAPAPLAPIASLETPPGSLPTAPGASNETPPASTVCYTGLRTGMGVEQQRRSASPARDIAP